MEHQLPLEPSMGVGLPITPFELGDDAESWLGLFEAQAAMSTRSGASNVTPTCRWVPCCDKLSGTPSRPKSTKPLWSPEPSNTVQEIHDVLMRQQDFANEGVRVYGLPQGNLREQGSRREDRRPKEGRRFKKDWRPIDATSTAATRGRSEMRSHSCQQKGHFEAHGPLAAKEVVCGDQRRWPLL
ncbi:hypothetical protein CAUPRSCDRAFT_11168 [Caulochytrium protostelioides]|uniref:Uncharacterized protein n=1 Tax=Caulochytrium protostelioides TaxID=1555241 RepID=A0A4P9WXZ8_9FUNG|nr:hypothetical protein CAUPRSCDRAFT_11168 [Caulochytrium protostelioides]